MHPFWSETGGDDGAGGFIAAGDLEVGEQLRLADGSPANVSGVEATGLIEPVYNFTVEGFHTYHVGELGVWVHNDVCLTKAFELVDDARAKLGQFQVKNKHLLGGGGHRKAARFNVSDQASARALIDEALESPNALIFRNTGTHESTSFRVVTDLGRPIGTKGQTAVRVVIGEDGMVFNAFPVNVK